MDAPVALHSWFKPHASLVIDGNKWVTNGYVAIAADVSGADKDLPADPVVDLAARSFAPRSPAVRERGFVILDGLLFQAHLFDLVAAAYPGATWLIGRESTDDYGWAVARVDAALVGVVMGARPGSKDEVCKPPACPACEGSGGPECAFCEGSGEIECHHCGHDTECDDCDGSGVDGVCPACKGSKVWTP